MKTLSLFLMLLLAVVLVPLLATSPERVVAPAGVTLGDAPTAVGVRPTRLTPLQQEIKAVIDSARAAEVRLLAQLGEGATTSHPAVQRHLR
jgi:hypothetical protein